MSVIQIRSGIRDYTVHFVENTDFLTDLTRYAQRCYVVDENVWHAHAASSLAGIAAEDLIVLPVNEDRKNLETVQELYNHLLQRSAKRNMTLISIGGGILQDISGFAASTLYRGINWIFVPTTLLAQADSCIGSKTSLNYQGYKNLLGTFFPPNEVYVYMPFLATQAELDFCSGLGEVVKLHLMGGAGKTQELIALLPKIQARDTTALVASVQSSLAIKLDYITGDEFDIGRRNLLNFGHCFGHALEAASDFKIPHGQAVLIGMVLANIAARRRGILIPETEQSVARELLLPSLRIRPTADQLASGKIIEGMKKDKKRTGEDLPLIMMENGFQMVRVSDFTIAEAAEALAEASKYLIDNP